jgi:transcriptional regulator with XRE-family HTH domain
MAYTTTVRNAAHLARLLTTARQLRGMTQQELADELGLTQKTVHLLETGAPTKYAVRLFQILGATGATMTIEIPAEGAEVTARG